MGKSEGGRGTNQAKVPNMYDGINLSCSSFPRELPVPLALERNAELARSQLGFANRFAFMGDINIPSHPPSLFPAKQKIRLLGNEGIGIGERERK